MLQLKTPPLSRFILLYDVHVAIVENVMHTVSSLILTKKSETDYTSQKYLRIKISLRNS
jgi:hypothetical protein